MIESLLRLLDRHSHICQAGLFLLVVGAIAVCVPRLKIDDSPERWMPQSVRDAWQELDRHFHFGDTVAVGLEYRRAVRDDDLSGLRWLRERLAGIPEIRQVFDVSLIAEDIEGVPLTQLFDTAQAENFKLYEGALWSMAQEGRAGRTLLTLCELKYDPQQDRQELNRIRREVVAAVNTVVDEARQRPEFREVDFHLAGGIIVMAELEDRARRAAVTFLPVSILVALGSLLLGFRSWPALVLAVGGGLIALVLVLGAIAAKGGGLGVLTMAAPTMISIVAIATTVHFAAFAADAHATAALGASGGEIDSRDPNWRRQLIRWVGVPCFGAAVTTAIGFLMLTLNELGPIRSLGQDLFLGSLLAFFSVFILSQMLPISRAYHGRLLLPERFRRWSAIVTRRPKTLTATVVLAMVVLSLLAYPWPGDSRVGLRVDVDPFSFFGPQHPIQQTKQHFADCRVGVYQLEVLLLPKEQGQAANDEQPGDAVWQANQQAAQAYTDKITARSDLGVLRAISTNSFRERQQGFVRLMGSLLRQVQTEGFWKTQERVQRLQQQLARFEKTFQDWNRDKLDQGAMRITFMARDRGDEGFEELLTLVESELPRERFDCYVAGTIATIVHLSQGMISGMLSGLGASALVMAGVCFALFRSWRLAAIAFLPNAFPIVVVYGVMGAAGVPLSSGSAMVATVALGIAFNDTIHFLLHYEKLTREQGHSIDSALAATFEDLGRPVVLTSVVHIAGFAIFLLTDFLPLFHFGLLSLIAMTSALLGDLVLLPNLLKVFDRLPAAAGKPGLTQTLPEPSADGHAGKLAKAAEDARLTRD